MSVTLSIVAHPGDFVPCLDASVGSGSGRAGPGRRRPSSAGPFHRSGGVLHIFR